VHLRNHRLRAAVDRLRGERNHLRVRATVDSLTGALGRRALSDCVEKGLAAGVPFAVLFVDVDHFKSVNDTFGHAIGDVALKRVAEALSRGRRTGDVCGRYGGEEFVLVINRVSREQAASVAERHRQAVARLRLVDAGGPERLTASFGVAWFDPECPDPSVEAIFKRADAALYRTKRAGRDRVELAEPRRDTAPSRLSVGSSEPGPTHALGESPDAHGPLPIRILARGDSVAPDPREEGT
jgi:diguanylate cyclase (GGDEF)-like protein